MHTADYIVRLDAFEGPMDLLLHLIKREEVDIHDIPIARIADQYLEHLALIQRIDIELAGEFLVTAATLIEIKSRMISPAAPVDPNADTTDAQSGGAPELLDPRAELVQQLLAYKRFRDAAHALEDRKATWEKRFPSAAAPTSARLAEEITEAAADADVAIDLDDLQLFDLVEAFSRIIETVDLDRARGAHEVRYDDTPIELHAEDVLDRLRRADSERAAPGESGMTLRALLEGRPRGEMIGLFLAVLELMRRRQISIAATHDRHDVRIALNEDPGDTATQRDNAAN